MSGPSHDSTITKAFNQMESVAASQGLAEHLFRDPSYLNCKANLTWVMILFYVYNTASKLRFGSVYCNIFTSVEYFLYKL